MAAELIRLLLGILTVYRLAQMITLDTGPFDIFINFRNWINSKSKENKYWANLDQGINCTYCVGIYAALFVALLLLFPTTIGSLFILWFGLAGGQAFLQDKKGI